MNSKALDQLIKHPEFIAKIIEINSLLIQILNPFLTFDEACDYLQISPNHLKKLCKEKSIPHYNSDGKKIISRKEKLDDRIKCKSKTKTKI